MNDVSPGKLTTLIGAGVTFIFSFLPWFTISGFGGRFRRSAWQSGLFPMATWVPVFAVIVGFVVAAQAFKFLELPEKIWEFTLDQIVLVLSAFATLLTLSYLITDKGGASVGFGLILCLLGTVAMIAGFFVDRAGIGVNPNAADGTAPFAQTGYPAPGQQVGQPPYGGPAAPAPQSAPRPAPPAYQPPMPQPPAQQPSAPQTPTQPQPPSGFDPGTGTF